MGLLLRHGAVPIDSDVATRINVTRDHVVADEIGFDRLKRRGAHCVQTSRYTDQRVDPILELLNFLLVAPVRAGALTDGIAALGHVVELGSDTSDRRVREGLDDAANRVFAKFSCCVGEDKHLALRF